MATHSKNPEKGEYGVTWAHQDRLCIWENLIWQFPAALSTSALLALWADNLWLGGFPCVVGVKSLAASLTSTQKVPGAMQLQTSVLKVNTKNVPNHFQTFPWGTKITTPLRTDTQMEWRGLEMG